MSEQLKVYQVDGDPNNASVVMLHGYGANGRDLMGITQVPELRNLDLNWYFLEAPLDPPELQAFGGKAWFSLTLSSFNPNMNPEALEKFYNMETSEFKQSMQLIKDTVWDLDLKGDVFMGGFSQGAMMAANVFMSDINSYAGLIAMSGAPLNYKNWKATDESKPVFISHGEQDPVLPFKCGADLDEKIKDSQLKIKTHWFQGGHEIPMSLLKELGSFLG